MPAQDHPNIFYEQKLKEIAPDWKLELHNPHFVDHLINDIIFAKRRKMTMNSIRKSNTKSRNQSKAKAASSS